MGKRDQEPALHLDRLERAYAQGSRLIEVLKGATASLYPGEAVALLGPSGAGKSTLLHIAGLLERPDAGAVVIEHGMGGARAAAPVAKDVLTYLFDRPQAEKRLAELEAGWGGTLNERMARRAAAIDAAVRADA